MQKRVPSQLIEKYLAGKCSVEEEAKLYEWYHSFNGSPDPLYLSSKREKKELKMKMLANISKEANLPNRALLPNRFLYFAAAGIAAVFVLVSILIKPAPQEAILTQVKKTLTPAQIDFTNHSGKIHKYKLPDNSIVWLSPNASIKYSANFIDKIRRVDFVGEAFFEVEKDKKHPFHIYSGDVVTEVLGTSFKVNTNAVENTTEVMVVTGKVLVRTTADADKGRKAESVYLEPKEKVTYLKDLRQLVKLDIKDQSLDIWKKSTLSFDNTPVASVIEALNKTFKSNISVADQQINNYTLKADFTDVNLPTIMELLSKSLNTTYEIQGENIIISQESQTNLNN